MTRSELRRDDPVAEAADSGHAARRRRASRCEGEQGSALVLALVMVFVVGVIAASVLSLSDTSLLATNAVKSDRRSLYAADGAAETAIQHLERDSTLCTNQGTTQTALDLPVQGGQPEALVNCQRTNTDLPGNGDANSNAPQYAVTTLGKRANQPSDEGVYNWNLTSAPPWGQTVEAGVFFQPALTGIGCSWFLGLCYKQTGDVTIAGSVFSNSNVAVNNPTGTGTQTIKTTDPSRFGFIVRQTCEVSSQAAINPSCVAPATSPSQVVGYGAGVDPDPHYPSRAAWQQGQPGGTMPQLQAVPACGTATLVVFSPGWYNDAVALNDLFRTCSNADGTGKDYWFQPGVYYFDFRNTSGAPQSSSQYCGVGIDNSPTVGASQSTMVNSPSFAHEWCIRGKYASDGKPASASDQYRPHVVGGEPKGWSTNPVSLLMEAATATSANPGFTNPNNGRHVDGTTADATWTGNQPTMVPGTAASADFTSPDNGKAIDTNVASLALVTPSTVQTPGTAASTDFTNPNNGKVIDTNNVASLALSSTSTVQTPGTAASTDFTNPNNGRVIDTTNVASSVLASTSIAQTPTTATSSQVSGSTDFTNPANGEVIGGGAATATFQSGMPVVPPLAATGWDNNPTFGYLAFDSGQANALTISGGSMTSSNSAVFTSNCGLWICGQGEIRLTGYPDIPATATPTAVTLNVRHYENPATTVGTLRVNVQDGNGSTLCTVNVSTNSNSNPASPYTASIGPGGTNCLTTAAAVNSAKLDFQVQGTAQWYGGGSTTFYLDGISLDVTYTDTANRTLTLSALAPQIANPGSTTVDAATLSLAHQETGAAANPRLVLSGPNISAAAACTTIGLTPRATLGTDAPIDLLTQLTSPSKCNIAKSLVAATLNGLNVAYVANLSAAGTATVTVDGIRVDVTSTDSTIRSITLSALNPAVPAANSVDKVLLSFAHQETVGSLNPTLVVTPGGGGTCTFALTSQSTLASETKDVSACLNTPTKVNGATFAYQVHLTDNGTAQSAIANVDGATVTTTSTDGATRSITLSALNPAVPAGNTVDAVSVVFAHHESLATVNPTLVITPGGGGTCTIALTPQPTLASETKDVSACLNTPTKVNGATFAYQVHLTDNGVAQSALIEVDGLRVTTLSTDTATHTLTLSNLSNQIPPGSNLGPVVLSFAHRETGASVSPTLVITPGGGGTCTFALTPQPALTTDTIDVKACLGTPTKINGATFAYQVHLSDSGASQNATASVDGAQLVVDLITDPTPRQITLSSFGPSVPAAALAPAVTIAVTHSESAGSSSDIVVTPGGGSACAAIALPSHTTLATDAVAVPTACLGTVTQINGAQAAFRVTPGTSSGSASLDGLQLSVQYYGAGTRPSFPAACDNGRPGVQWIFGGDSHVYIPDATVELCAGPSPGQPGDTGYTAQQIAIYGVPPVPTMRPTTVSNNEGYSNPNNALMIGDYNPAGGVATADASVDPFSGSKSITLGGFNTPAVGPGLVVTDVTARVSHGEDLLVGAPSVRFTNGLGQTCSKGLTWYGFLNAATWLGPASDVIDLTTECAGFSTDALAGLTATFTGSGWGNEHFDGIELDVTLGPATADTAVFVPENGCITARPNYWDGMNNPDCALAKWDSAELDAKVLGIDVGGWFVKSLCVTAQPGGNACLPNAQVTLAGTVYAPGAAVSVDDQGTRNRTLAGCSSGNGTACYAGVNYPIFDRGVLVRHLRFTAFKAAAGYTGPVISCDGGPCTGGVVPAPRQVTLTSYVCLDKDASGNPVHCTAPVTDTQHWRLRISARAEIPVDPTSGTTRILGWRAN